MYGTHQKYWLIFLRYLIQRNHLSPNGSSVWGMGSMECNDSSVQFSHSVVSNSLWPHESQHTRPPCPSGTARVHSDSRPSSQWCHPAISSSVVLLPPIPPSIRVFSNESTLCMRWSKYWSFSFSISPSNEHPGLISFQWTGWISLQSKGLSRIFSNTTVQKHQFFGAQLSSQSNSHIHTWPLEKP